MALLEKNIKTPHEVINVDKLIIVCLMSPIVGLLSSLIYSSSLTETIKYPHLHLDYCKISAIGVSDGITATQNASNYSASKMKNVISPFWLKKIVAGSVHCSSEIGPRKE